MKGLTITLVFLYVLTVCYGEEVRLLDLDPPEAQQHIDNHDQSLHYAPKIESNVPAVRYLGNEPHNVLEDIYSARQYHGQDGLGGYLYGYNIPDIAKTEKKIAGGDLTGAYNYVADTGDEIKVQYWDDGTGFHQVDNVGDILKSKQVQDTPEVQAEKDKFLARWREEAERNQRPVTSPYNAEGQYASGPLSAQGQIEYKNLVYGQTQYQHQPSSVSSVYQQPGQYKESGYGKSSYQQQGSGQYDQTGVSGTYQQPANGQYHQTGESGAYQLPENGQDYQAGQSGVSATYQQPGHGQYHQNGVSGTYQQPVNGQYHQTGVSGTYQHPGNGQDHQAGQSGGSSTYQQPGHGQNHQTEVSEVHPQPAQYNLAGSLEPTYLPSQSSDSYPSGSAQYQQPGQYPQGSGHCDHLRQGNPNQIDYTGAYSERQSSYSNPAASGVVYAEEGTKYDQSGGYEEKWEEKEENGPPKGFFYSFDYPVGKIVQKGEVANVGELHQVYNANKAKYDGQLMHGAV